MRSTGDRTYREEVPSTPSGVIAAASLALGFAVAELTGVRLLGGVVLLAGVGLCWPRWRRQAGVGGAAALLAAYAAVFVLSHLLGHVIGAWPSVVTVSVLMGVLAWVVADRRGASGADVTGRPGRRSAGRGQRTRPRGVRHGAP